jgi:cytochrome c oxidase subunit II
MVKRTAGPLTGAGLVLAALVFAGCGDNGQSTLDPHSHASREVSGLWWAMMAAAWVVLAGAVAFLVLAWVRRRRTGLPFFGEREEINARAVVLFGILIPIVSVAILFVFANFEVSKATEAPAAGSTAMTVDVVGHQWFWEFRYPGSRAVTANELHIPVGTRVNVVVRTADVIHSFWVPELNRKIDTIPGHPNRILLAADEPGTYRGQCAEFCGLQHAHMAFSVTAQSRADYDAWLAAQAAPAAKPATAAARTGEQVFMANACASCHTIRGTPARGLIGPDLTHVASRATLAGLTIPDDAEHLLAWISDPQSIKPGVKMPGLDLSGADFRAVASYVGGLR